MKNKSGFFGGRWLTVLLVVFFLAYFIYQIFASLMPLTTGTAVFYTSYDGIQTTGTIIRDEHIVTDSTEGVRYFVVGDGEKVSKGGAIANIYSTQQESQAYSDINALEKKISALEEITAYNNTDAVDMDLLNNRIDASLLSVLTACQDGTFQDSADSDSQLLKYLNRKKIALGEEADYASAIAGLKAQLATLSAASPVAKANITSTVSGYFVSTADGFESVLTPDAAKTMTPEQFQSLETAPATEGTVGKIVSDYTWYISCVVPLKDSAAFKIGDSVKIKTTLNSASELKVTVEAINLGAGDDVLMVFACHNMNGELATVRSIPITVVTGEYSGLRISNEAVRIVDGKSGVYVISGMQAKFVEINIIHSAGGYTLCELNPTNSTDELRLYDEVIEKGRNLYDGKIIR